MKKISIAAAGLLVLLTAIAVFSNIPYFMATSAFGTFAVTLLLFIVVAVVVMRGKGTTVFTLILIALMMVVPIRALICAVDFNPFENINIELVEYQENYYGEASRVELRYTNNTGVYLSDVSGTLSFYEGDELIAKYDVYTNATFPSELTENNIFYSDMEYERSQDQHICYMIHELNGTTLCNLDWSTLRIEYTFSSVQFDDAGIADFSFDPITVRLK